jgi:4-amino-4-deoxy-L-arabinose transferase-like glycosyltransferase
MNKLDGRKKELLLLVGLTLLALIPRIWQIGSVPPGWRDDELINYMVISQKVLDGDLAVYYADASGHEALYHALGAGLVYLFGFSTAGIRGLSVIMGTLTVPLTYLIGGKLFGRLPGIAAAVGLAFSFWSLMYSRIGLRHISVVFFTLLAFYFFWRGLINRNKSLQTGKPDNWLLNFGLAGLFLGMNFYTYFASRGVPLILVALVIFLALFQQAIFKKTWRGFVLAGLIAAVLAVPLIITLSQQPDSEARVAELAVPLIEARAGNFQPLGEHIIRTLSMFHSDGDDEWLYNIPYRPVFGPIGAIFFWVGVLIAAWKSIVGIFRRPAEENALRTASYPFLLVWWLAGIAPGFVSVPAASLGHTIIAQPAVFLIAALPIGAAIQAFYKRKEKAQGNSSWIQHIIDSRLTYVILALLLVGRIGWRDTADYFNEWSNRGMVRFLYRADNKDLSRYLADHPELIDFGATSLLAGPWDKKAFEIDQPEGTTNHPRWYNPERAVLLEVGGERPLAFSGYPVVPMLYESWYNNLPGETAGGYRLAEISSPLNWANSEAVCFQNGLCWLAAEYNQADQTLDIIWQVKRPLSLVEEQLVSNPPPPGIYNGPRLVAFGQLLDSEDNFLAGDDGLWVDVYSLQPGDVFLQQHRPFIGEGRQPAAVLIGLYDPLTAERILTEDGRDHIRLELD